MLNTATRTAKIEMPAFGAREMVARSLGAAASAAPDADAQASRLHAEWLAVYEAYEATKEDESPSFKALVKLQGEILALPVTTAAGLALKILVITNFGEFELADEYLDAILADCERIAGVNTPPRLAAHRAIHGSWRHRG